LSESILALWLTVLSKSDLNCTKCVGYNAF
jgi:hypothetical protein